MRKPIVTIMPVEFGCHSWGPFQWEHRRIYYPDGSDWNGQWSIGIQHIGQIALIPPAWLLNAFVRWGWIALRPLDEERLEEARKLTDLVNEKKPWLDPRYR